MYHSQHDSVHIYLEVNLIEWKGLSTGEKIAVLDFIIMLKMYANPLVNTNMMPELQDCYHSITSTNILTNG